MAGIFMQTRSRSVKNAADTKLEKTSLSTGVLQRVFLKTPAMLSCFLAKNSRTYRRLLSRLNIMKCTVIKNEVQTFVR